MWELIDFLKGVLWLIIGIIVISAICHFFVWPAIVSIWRFGNDLLSKTSTEFQSIFMFFWLFVLAWFLDRLRNKNNNI